MQVVSRTSSGARNQKRVAGKEKVSPNSLAFCQCAPAQSSRVNYCCWPEADTRKRRRTPQISAHSFSPPCPHERDWKTTRVHLFLSAAKSHWTPRFLSMLWSDAWIFFQPMQKKSKGSLSFFALHLSLQQLRLQKQDMATYLQDGKWHAFVYESVYTELEFFWSHATMNLMIISTCVMRDRERDALVYTLRLLFFWLVGQNLQMRRRQNVRLERGASHNFTRWLNRLSAAIQLGQRSNDSWPHIKIYFLILANFLLCWLTNYKIADQRIHIEPTTHY